MSKSDGEAKRQRADRVVIVMNGNPDLLEVVHALNASCRLPRLLYRGQQQADQDGDDGNDDEQFDQRETPRILFICVPTKLGGR